MIDMMSMKRVNTVQNHDGNDYGDDGAGDNDYDDYDG